MACLERSILYETFRNRICRNQIADIFKSVPLSEFFWHTPSVFDKTPLSRSYY